MYNFFYKVRDYKSGNILQGYIKARDIDEVSEYLRKTGYLIIDIKHNIFLDKKVYIKEKLNKRKISEKDFILLCKQLSVILESGIDLFEAMQLIAENLNNEQLKIFLRRTIEKLSSGESLSQIWTMERFMPSYIVASISIAEKTGLLAKTFQDLSVVLEKEYSLKQQIKQILIYPIFLLNILGVILILMSCFVLPTFSEIFSKMNMQLPLVTLMILKLNVFIKSKFIYLCIILAFVYIICKYLIYTKRIAKQTLYKLLIAIPGFDLVKNIILIRLLRQLNYLLSSGINIDESLDIIIASNDNFLVKDSLQKVKNFLNRGECLSKAFSRTLLTNGFLEKFIEVGEKTGMISSLLEYVISFWEKDVDNKIKVYTQLLEPTLMIFVGLIVGLVVTAIILPMFNLVNSVGL